MDWKYLHAPSPTPMRQYAADILSCRCDARMVGLRKALWSA
jgi:hypothetical protein